ncbi:MAG: N-acetyltransferase [Terracidiphilus sp.]|nr:N-acetyltransferase [Terracidiphilus sp.]
MRVRTYNPDDFTALYEIEEMCFLPAYRFSRRYMQELLDKPNSAAWITEVNGEMAGFAIVEWTKELNGTNAYIGTIEVATAFRRRGLGSALVAKCEESARDVGAAVLWLHVEEGNAGAVSLYHAHGFECLGTEEHFYAPGRNALVYRKVLMGQR